MSRPLHISFQGCPEGGLVPKHICRDMTISQTLLMLTVVTIAKSKWLRTGFDGDICPNVPRLCDIFIVKANIYQDFWTKTTFNESQHVSSYYFGNSVQNNTVNTHIRLMVNFLIYIKHWSMRHKTFSKPVIWLQSKLIPQKSKQIRKAPSLIWYCEKHL